MVANSNPGDLERAEDSPGSSPGGVRSVEPVVPQSPLSSSPAADQEQAEALGVPEAQMAPHAIPLNGGDVIEMPESGGWHAAPAGAVDLTALIWHHEAVPENHPEHIEPFNQPTWEELIQPLDPVAQDVYRNFDDGMQRLFAELIANPTRTTMSDAEM
ncbi:hypothetical protein PCANC_07227 [Puccinia coronata f. sp. avenae]|uniref:Uncharacterized protein n=1 Tax=Puccinia coronata f. sp. avenae TaxID=200324 RepID=A0A2N5VU78_9BASI|nr:hypothetical protein PCASD_08534 [Puccinia coronata f. sp. avenae]PLW53537.1 hypothetical protein PCANC_07227 [Puccinia coronata f. sp. avenae]